MILRQLSLKHKCYALAVFFFAAVFITFVAQALSAHAATSTVFYASPSPAQLNNCGACDPVKSIVIPTDLGGPGDPGKIADSWAESFIVTSTVHLSSVDMQIAETYANDGNIKMCVVPDSAGSPLYTSSTAPASLCGVWDRVGLNHGGYAMTHFSFDGLDTTVPSTDVLYRDPVVSSYPDITLNAGQIYWLITSVESSPVNHHQYRLFQLPTTLGGFTTNDTSIAKYYDTSWHSMPDWQYNVLKITGRSDAKDVNVAVILAEPSGTAHLSNSIMAQPCKLITPKTYSGHSLLYFQDLLSCAEDYYKDNFYGSVRLNFTVFDNGGNWYPLAASTADYVGHEEQFANDATNKWEELSGRSRDRYQVIVAVHPGDSSERGDSGNLETHTSSGLFHPNEVFPNKIVIAESDRLGDWVHEIGHALGENVIPAPNQTLVPDLYKMGLSTGTISFFNIAKEGQWDVMGLGNNNGGSILHPELDGTDPPQMSSYTKEFLQLLRYDSHARSAYGTYPIDALEQKLLGDTVFRYNLTETATTDDNITPYYILETRKSNLASSMWDTSVPVNGLVVYYANPLGFPKYGYSTTTLNGTPVDPYNSNQCRTLNIPHGGVLGVGDEFDDYDNSISISALSDDGSVGKYSITAQIAPIDKNSFVNKFKAMFLRPTQDFNKSACTRQATGIASLPPVSKNISHAQVTEGSAKDENIKYYGYTTEGPHYFNELDSYYDFFIRLLIIFVIPLILLIFLVIWLMRHKEVGRLKKFLLIVLFITVWFIAASIYYVLWIKGVLQIQIRPNSAAYYAPGDIKKFLIWLAAFILLLWGVKRYKGQNFLGKPRVRKLIFILIIFSIALSLALITYNVYVLKVTGRSVGVDYFQEFLNDFFRRWDGFSVSSVHNISHSPADDKLVVADRSSKSPIFNGEISPDLDLHAITPDGKHVGMNYVTGQYENQIPGAIVSGNNQGSPEWILLPASTTAKFYVSSYSNQAFLNANPGIASQLASTNDSYDIYARYIDPSTGIFTSQTETNQTIAPATNVVYGTSGTSTISVSAGIVDNQPPVITTSVVSSTYLLNSAPTTFTFDVTDTGVGVAHVTSTLDGVPITSGQQISFTQPGNHAIVITAADLLGNTASTILNYSVNYNFGGFLPPIKTDGSGIYNLGRTLPVKFQLTDVSGSFVSTAAAHLVVTNVQNGIVGTVPVDLATENNDTGGLFRYDSANNQYIYNFDTGQLTTGTWQLKIELDDGNNYTVQISLR